MDDREWELPEDAGSRIGTVALSLLALAVTALALGLLGAEAETPEGTARLRGLGLLLCFVDAAVVFCLIWVVLASFGPRFELQICPAQHVSPGAPTTLRWQRTGGFGRLRELHVRCVLVESLHTGGEHGGAGRTCHERVLHHARGDAAVDEGALTFTLPARTMHTLLLPGYKLVWRLRVRARAGWFPRSDRWHPLTVLPAQTPPEPQRG